MLENFNIQNNTTMITNFRYPFLLLALFLFVSSCGETPKTVATKKDPEVPSLKSAFQDDFYIGAALGSQPY